MDRFIGKRLDGRYEIRELIGVGGMAVVYKAYDNIDDRIVAIKILKEEFLANDEFRRRFKNESKAIAVLSHPNIVKVYDVSFGDVLQYIVMEYINGITLKQYIEQQGVIEWKEAVHFTEQILRALQHAHEKGIIHRDIKPQNIMLLPNGNIKVTDFGIARFSRSEQRTITDKAIGSVHYISPEQARGDFTDGKADIYSVGVLLYEMTTGRVPFQADSAVSVAIMQLQNEPVRPTEINPNIPYGLEEITLKAMQKEPHNRFISAREMLQDIERLIADPAIRFHYKYIAEKPDAQEDNEPEDTEDVSEERAKAPVVPILAGIAAVFLVVMAVVLVIVWNLFSNSGTTLICPDFVGKNYNDIINDPEYSKYNFKLTQEHNAEYEIGEIFKQSPEAGRTIKEKSEIQVWVSLGGQSLTLNDYTGDDFKTVNAALTEDLGLKVTRIDVADENVQQGYVIQTIPPAGSTVRTGDTITVYVSSGKEVEYVEIRDYTGMEKDAAKKDLVALGMTVNIVYRYNIEYPYDYVVGQSPAAGSVEKGSVVTLYISDPNAITSPPRTTASSLSEEETTYTAQTDAQKPSEDPTENE